jgi:hypothetical protein
MENKTAVEWLIEQISNDFFDMPCCIKSETAKKALEIEEQQIKDAFETAFIEAYKLPLERDFNTSGQYYSETYPIKF